MSYPAVRIDTAANPQMAIIWLHGLGADGHDFEPVVPQFQSLGIPLRFVFPHAPVQPVTINGGMAMRSWYDIKGLDIGARADEAGIRASQQIVHQLIDEQVQQGIAPANIVLAGFSQGAALTLHTGTRYPEKLAGMVALSGYLPMPEKLPAEKHPANQNTPLFMAHGSRDPVVPYSLGEASAKILQANGYPVEWHSYPVEHGVTAEEIADIAAFISRLAPPQPTHG
jgi:phospholipase/carboxylesterase